MMQELPGILNRLVAAYQARKERGRDLVTDPTIQREFEQASDRVTMWMAEEMRIVQGVIPGQTLPADGCTIPTVLGDMFNRWAVDNHSSGMTRKKVVQRVASLPGVVEVRQERTKSRAFNVVRKRDGDDGLSAGSAGSAPIPETIKESRSGPTEAVQEKVSPGAAEPAEPAESQLGDYFSGAGPNPWS
jgi:phage/plasmid-associated DNA primase